MGPILITKAPLVAYLNTSFTTPRNIAVVSVLGLQPAADAAFGTPGGTLTNPVQALDACTPSTQEPQSIP